MLFKHHADMQTSKEKRLNQCCYMGSQYEISVSAKSEYFVENVTV